MIHRMLRYPAGWNWHIVQQARHLPQEQKPLPSRKSVQRAPEAGVSIRKNIHSQEQDEQTLGEEAIAELKRQFVECSTWVDECAGRRTNHISVDDYPGIGPILCGTLMIQVSEEQSDVQPFHFWLSRKRLITMHEDMRIPMRLQNGSHTLKYDECQIAPEAFFIMIGVMLEPFHTGLDGFERRLGELEKTMRIQNRTGLIDVIFERRYDLLHWSHLFIPIRELHGAAKESFVSEISETDSFIKMSHKLERIETLLKHYALEIDTLISMDDAISSFRGNDIMKTLTIFTVLFLPATIVGTLMGSNFDTLPYQDHKWGFTVMVAGVSLITIGIYIWLWKKGWTGDLLNRRRGPFLLPEQDEPAGRSSRHGKQKKSSSKLSTMGEHDKNSLLRSRKNRV
ncbi:magnesium transporter CorA family protein [Paenibacillus sp. GSMTC-2017]|uniref:magnesium transporter CorA family protein n=1 Tax=Paenibacillus sp. GSMTC-2017 TaxID=2794350 RepID=UPI0018D7919D|nr:magnesium transporter CorA family protein [Paenibacillus sp. GSMTC-2017]MBH5320008.1 magnesium transporter CorA family protein [Paenibacillus sp. GSMTC-2017]